MFSTMAVLLILGLVFLGSRLLDWRLPASIYSGLIIIGVLYSWYRLFWFMNGLVGGLLAPWYLTSDRPAVGTWSRAVHDLFESFPGNYLPGTLIVGASLLIFGWRLVRTSQQQQLGWLFLLSNLSFTLIVLPLLLPAAVLNSAILSSQAGLAKNLPLLVILGLLVAALLLVQGCCPLVFGQRPRFANPLSVSAG